MGRSLRGVCRPGFREDTSGARNGTPAANERTAACRITVGVRIVINWNALPRLTAIRSATNHGSGFGFSAAKSGSTAGLSQSSKRDSSASRAGLFNRAGLSKGTLLLRQGAPAGCQGNLADGLPGRNTSSSPRMIWSVKPDTRPQIAHLPMDPPSIT